MNEEDWYALLPPQLLKTAYKAVNDELAWSKEQALSIVDILITNKYVVLGVDVWMPTNPGPTIPVPFVYDWSLKKLPRGDLYPDTAKEFITSFEWDPTDKSHGNLNPVFNISAEKLKS